MNTSIDIVRLTVVGTMVLLVFSPLSAPLFSSNTFAKPIAVTLQTLSLATLGFVFFVFDYAMAFSQSWIFCGLFLTAGVGISISLGLRLQSRVSFGLGMLFATGIVICSLIDLSPVKPYRRFFSAIHEGMNKAQVMTILNHQFPESSRFPMPVLASEQPDRLSFILDPKQGTYNAEVVALEMNDGKVISKDYLPD